MPSSQSSPHFRHAKTNSKLSTGGGRSDPPGGGGGIHRRLSARCDHRGRRQGWRDSRQQPSAGAVSLRQPSDRNPYHSSRPPGRCRPPAVSWLVLHVSARGGPADRRKRLVERAVGANQPMVRAGQNRRRDVVSGLSGAVWPALYQRHSNQFIWPGGQFSPREQPCAGGPDAPFRRRQTGRRGKCGGMGQRPAAPRVPACRRPRRRLCVFAGPL